ncbi:MAG TPA: hypothetical protein VG735_00030 [Caulobacterales bacterium]|nr:hypothetical protein [Caulobacterales bacterium]
MAARSAKAALDDIVSYGEASIAFVEGRDAAGLLADRKSWMATIYSLQCVSEAVRRLPEANNPDLPWREIMSAGNVYRHGMTQYRLTAW